jgi:hypothetical protein
MKNDNVSYESRAITMRGDNGFHKPRAITIKISNFFIVLKCYAMMQNCNAALAIYNAQRYNANVDVFFYTSKCMLDDSTLP